ncbi:MAG: M24 family metallopeptidase [Lentisphaerae bacterium]|nr:M24 family metallopeptidase [Lentisphaerota bacterium]
MSATPGNSPSGRLIYAGSETCADLAYGSGFLAPDPFLWYEIPGESGLVVSILELGRARNEARPGLRIRSLEEARRAWGVPAAQRSPAALIAGLARASGVRHWAVPGGFPLGLARELGRRRLRLETREPFAPERECKTASEIAEIRAGVRLAEAGLAAGLEVLAAAAIRPDGWLTWEGRTLDADTLRGEIVARIARLGGTAARTITAAGVHGADPHDMGSGPIPAHVPIVIDIFPRVDRSGYFGDLTRTVVKGRATTAVRRVYEAVRHAQEAALAILAPGLTGQAAQRAAEAALEADGFPTDLSADPPRGFIHSLGHGLGLEIHESPGLNSRNSRPLQAGHVVTVEPGYYDPAWGGIRLEDVVVITADGCENLTTAPKVLEIP